MVTLNVKGMTCTSCEMLIKDALEDVGVNDASVSSKKGKVEFESNVDINKIKKAIKEEGFDVE